MLSNVKNRARQAAASTVLKAAGKAEQFGGGDLSDIKELSADKGVNGLFASDTRAQTNGAQAAVNLVVGLLVGALMAAFLLPIAIDEIADVDTSSWDNGAGALWGILPVIIVLAIFLFFVGLALARSDL